MTKCAHFEMLSALAAVHPLTPGEHAAWTEHCINCSGCAYHRSQFADLSASVFLAHALSQPAARVSVDMHVRFTEQARRQGIPLSVEGRRNGLLRFSLLSVALAALLFVTVGVLHPIPRASRDLASLSHEESFPKPGFSFVTDRAELPASRLTIHRPSKRSSHRSETADQHIREEAFSANQPLSWKSTQAPTPLALMAQVDAISQIHRFAHGWLYNIPTLPQDHHVNLPELSRLSMSREEPLFPKFAATYAPPAATEVFQKMTFLPENSLTFSRTTP